METIWPFSLKREVSSRPKTVVYLFAWFISGRNSSRGGAKVGHIYMRDLGVRIWVSMAPRLILYSTR